MLICSTKSYSFSFFGLLWRVVWRVWMRSICVGAKYLRPFRANHNPLMANKNRKIMFFKEKDLQNHKNDHQGLNAWTRWCSGQNMASSSPKQRERHILPKTLPRVTGPNKAALKLLVLVSRLLVLYNLRRNLIQSVYSWNLDPGSEKKCCIVQGRVWRAGGMMPKLWGH